MVLFAPGNGLNVAANDNCDSSTTWRIVRVTSNQLPTGNGSGQTPTDVNFGSGAFCVRSERDGASKTPRQYTVTIESTDGSGNKSSIAVVIEVPHDQGGGGCDSVDASRIVEDDDPRCLADAPTVLSPSAPASAVAAASPNDEPPPASTRAGGCSTAGSTRQSSNGAAFIFFCVALAVSGRRRLRNALFTAALACIGFIAGCSNSTSKPLDQCVVGWWRNPLYGGCLCPTEPECTASDCKAIDFQGYLADHRFFSGTVTWSAQLQTMSSEGAASTGTFSISANALSLTRGPADQVSQAMTCSGDSLTIEGADSTRADSGLTTALSAATSTGLMWKSYPVTRQ
jgi:hypothetical protein